MRAVVVLATLAGCGRFDFGVRGDAAASGDATHLDAAGDGLALGSDAPTGCAAHSYELCDDFEAADFKPVWTIDPGVSLDGSVAHRGTQSVHFRLPATNAGTGAFVTLTEAATLPLGDPTTYVRAYIRFGALPAANNQMELVAAQQPTDMNEDAVFMSSADLAVYKQWAPQDSEHDLSEPPFGTWLCVLFTIQRSTTATGSLSLGGDVAAVNLSSVQTDGSPPLADLVFGPQLAASNQPDNQPVLEVWMDDVIVDKDPVTCAD